MAGVFIYLTSLPTFAMTTKGLYLLTMSEAESKDTGEELSLKNLKDISGGYATQDQIPDVSGLKPKESFSELSNVSRFDDISAKGASLNTRNSDDVLKDNASSLRSDNRF